MPANTQETAHLKELNTRYSCIDFTSLLLTSEVYLTDNCKLFIKRIGIRFFWFPFERKECQCGGLYAYYLEAKQELANCVADADAFLSTGSTPQLIYDDQGPVTYIVDYVSDLWRVNMQSIIISLFISLLKKVRSPNVKIQTYLLHFQHEGGRVCFKIIIHTYPGENLISNTKRCILSRNKGTWNTKQCKGVTQKVKSNPGTVQLHIPGSCEALEVCC